MPRFCAKVTDRILPQPYLTPDHLENYSKASAALTSRDLSSRNL